MSASSVIGIGSDGTSFEGGVGALIANGALIAPQIVIGRNGVLGGNGVVMGDTINRGTVAPGESPGRLTFDGGFDSRDGGRIVLEIEQQSDGTWLFDELVFTDVINLLMDGALIEFDFHGNANPMDFLDAGLFSFGSFFKEGDGAGGVMPPSQELMARFASASYSASSDFYTLHNFTFTPAGGASFDIAQVPLPPSVALVLLGLVGLVAVPRRAAAPR